MKHLSAFMLILASTTQLASCGFGSASESQSNAVGASETTTAISQNTQPLQSSCESRQGALLALTPSEPPKACTVKSWLAGSSELCHGHLIYRDYLYDDHGADTGGLVTDSMTAAGDKTYPAGAANTADLVQLQLWTANNRLYIRGELNTLFDAAQTTLAIAIDTDNNRNTGGGKWCSLPVSSTGWEVLQVFRKGDIQSNVIEGSIPMPAGNTWRVQALTAQADGTVMNVAFRGTEEQSGCKTNTTGSGCFFEDKQAAALANGDISAFGQLVAVDDLKQKANRPAAPINKGLHSRVYESAYTLGEGLGDIAGRGDGGQVPVAAQKFVYLGKYQPYGLYVPTPQAERFPLQMVFHGSGNVHSSLISQPGLQRDFGDQFGRLLVTPLARGSDGYGSDISERDILDVMNDVENHFKIDSSRVIASGYSQGGYITYRMAMLYPDKFAGFVSWVGFTGEALNGPAQGLPVSGTAGAVGNVRDFVGNLRNIPGVMLVAGADELVHVTSTSNMEQAFASTDNRYKWYLHPVAQHITFAMLDNWQKEAADSADWKLESNPARVTFRHDPTLGNSQYDIRHDRAYWISSIKNRVVGQSHLDKIYSDIDLQTSACGAQVPVSTATTNFGQSPVPWTSREKVEVTRQTLTVNPLLEGRVANIASLTVDADKTCLKGLPIKYTIKTDGPVTISFSDGRRLNLNQAGDFNGVLN